ncbi:hypothetical protein DFP73DRAFT_107018 [Morchella snyderi]|nr:hypothetical protein DFP73DRAFT_107018 [Morchella snyderi]
MYILLRFIYSLRFPTLHLLSPLLCIPTDATTNTGKHAPSPLFSPPFHSSYRHYTPSTNPDMNSVVRTINAARCQHSPATVLVR